MKHHLFAAKIPKKLFKKIKELGDNDKKDEFKQERMFGMVAKILIANTLNGLVAMDFVGYGDYSTFLHIRDTFSRFSAIIFLGDKKKGEQTAEMVKESVISEWIPFFGDTWNNDGG